MNEIFLKRCSRRQSEKEKILGENNEWSEIPYNNLSKSSSCALEFDAFINDIYVIERKRLFPVNDIFNPTLPGVINLWNDQYKRSSSQFEIFLNKLKSLRVNVQEDDEDSQLVNIFHRIFFPESRNDIEQIPQLDGQVDNSEPSTSISYNYKKEKEDGESEQLSVHFNGKQIKIDPDKVHTVKIQCRKFQITEQENIVKPLSLNHSRGNITLHCNKARVLEETRKKIKSFMRPLDYLCHIRNKIRTYSVSNPISNEPRIDVKSTKSSRSLMITFSANSDNSMQIKANTSLSSAEILKQIQIDCETSSIMSKSILEHAMKDYTLNQDESKNLSSLSFNLDSDLDNYCDSNILSSKNLSLTSLSLELHGRSRENLIANPNYDPIQLISYAIHQEFLDDSGVNNSDIQSIGTILVRSRRKFQRNCCETITINDYNVIVDYVTNELELISKLNDIIDHHDPDIFLGYTIDTSSWGYLLQRCSILEININSFSRIIKDTSKTQRNYPGSLNEPPKLIGRIMLNVWRILRHEITLRSYSIENVYHHLFRKRFPRYESSFLAQLYEKFEMKNSELSRNLFIEYYLNRSIGSLKILSHLNLIRRTFDLSCLFGMPFQDVIERGSQYRVESMLFPLCRSNNLLPIRFDKNFVEQQRAYQAIPLIFEPEITYRSDPVAVFDFQSLYPSIIIAYNYCYSTCLGRLQNIFG